MNAELVVQYSSIAVLCWLVLANTRRGRQFVIWLDQGLSFIIGSGWADETPSAYYHRRGDWRERAVNLLFWWQKDAQGRRNHCERAWLAEYERRHIPPEMRELNINMEKST